MVGGGWSGFSEVVRRRVLGLVKHHLARTGDLQHRRQRDVAIVGDTAPVDVMGREPMRTALTAPTATEGIAAAATAGRQIMQRTGELFAVAQQAAALEPLVAEAWQQGREQSHHAQRLFWTGMSDDGLLPPSCDLDWLIDTAGLLAAAETYLLITRLHGWALDTYETWLRRTLTQLVGAPVPRET